MAPARNASTAVSTEAKAVQQITGVQEAALRNIRAGVDIVLTTGRGSYIQVYRALLAEGLMSRGLTTLTSLSSRFSRSSSPILSTVSGAKGASCMA